MAGAPLFDDVPSLRHFILATAEGESDPRLVADKVLGQLTTLTEWQTVADAAFTHYVWEQLKRPHPVHIVTQSTEDHVPTPQGAMPIFRDSYGNDRPSAKQVAFVDALGNELNRRVKVGNGVEDRKHLAECTVDDLTWMVDYRQRVAQRNIAAADQYQKLADAMTNMGAATVADLDRRVTEAILLG